MKQLQSRLSAANEGILTVTQPEGSAQTSGKRTLVRLLTSAESSNEPFGKREKHFFPNDMATGEH